VILISLKIKGSNCPHSSIVLRMRPREKNQALLRRPRPRPKEK